jgi:hypothetical protein
MFWTKINDVSDNEDNFIRFMAIKEISVYILLLKTKRKYVGLSLLEINCLRQLLNKIFLLKVCCYGERKEKEKINN